MRTILHLLPLFFLLALAGGFAWGKGWGTKQADAAPRETPDPARRAEARQLLERAVEARHADLTNEAMRLAVQAKSTDAAVPGADLFAAEMALREGNAQIAEAAAREALKQDQYAADAALILALNAWMLRGQPGGGSAGATSQQLLAEAADAELSNGAVRFFAGDLQRATGRPSEAHRSLLGGLYRQQPWHSAALLAAKLALIVEQADGADGAALFDVGNESEKFGTIAAALARSQKMGADATAANAVHATFTRKHFEVLADDPALHILSPDEQEPENFLPHGEVAPPALEREPAYLMPWDREVKALGIRNF